jgi:hypothetical protein
LTAVAHLDGKLGVGEVVQDRLVVSIDQHHDALAEFGFCFLDQGEAMLAVARKLLGLDQPVEVIVQVMGLSREVIQSLLH